mgnify:CR=1 FL=1
MARRTIRPERIRLNGHSEACPNRFSGRIAEFIYLGDHIRIRLEVCGVSDFFVKQPIAEFDQALRVGDVVPIGWHVEHVDFTQGGTEYREDIDALERVGAAPR